MKPLEMLRLTFTTQQPEAFFAITEAELISWLNQVGEGIQVQAYRSASGELLTETLVKPGDVTALLAAQNRRGEHRRRYSPAMRWSIIPVQHSRDWGWPC